MKLVKECQARKVQKSDKCEVLEYPLGDKEIDMAIANLKGRYPYSGYCLNQECKELIYVIDGKGTLNKREEKVEFQKGDVILIDKGEAFYWDAYCTMAMSCTPAWYKEQYKLIEE